MASSSLFDRNGQICDFGGTGTSREMAWGEIINCHLKYLAKTLSLDTVGFGYLQTVFGILQLVGGPIFGRFSDQYGARAALTLSCLSASVYYLLLAFTTNIPLLFLSRLPSIFMHGLPGAQMIITDQSTPEERAGSLGKLGLCFGVGIIIGSSLGGFLASRFGLYTPSYISLAASLMCCVIVQIYIPVRTKISPDKPGAELGNAKSTGIFSFSQMSRLMRYPDVLPVFMVKVLSGFPLGVFMLMFPIISVDFFGLNAATAGYLMSYFGITQLVVQGLMVGRLTRWFRDDAVLILSMAVSMVVGLGLVLMTNVLHFCFIVPLLIFALSVSGTITDSILTKAVPSAETGTMLGICASVQPFTRTLGPTIGGYLYKHYGVPAFGLFNVTVSLGLLMYLINRHNSRKVEKRT
ncbi:solute carrier family 22 member 18 isoform X1 [Hyperolius riggenbachi]|uniref:solute carrier family 22 member 18 isoform X1 n=1 Tax=Hyperolius riggenbachi TaxID=752182 RepID=UPI0035A28F1C